MVVAIQAGMDSIEIEIETSCSALVAFHDTYPINIWKLYFYSAPIRIRLWVYLILFFYYTGTDLLQIHSKYIKTTYMLAPCSL